MKTIADLKRAMIAGSKWACYNHIYQTDMGIRQVSKTDSVKVAFMTRKDGVWINSYFNWPSKKDVEFEGDKVNIYWEETKNTERKLALTYTKAD
jgi:hypothetical protein